MLSHRLVVHVMLCESFLGPHVTVKFNQTSGLLGHILAPFLSSTCLASTSSLSGKNTSLVHRLWLIFYVLGTLLIYIMQKPLIAMEILGFQNDFYLLWI